MIRRLAAATGIVCLALLAIPVEPVGAAEAPGFLGVAAADGVRVGLNIDHFVVVSDIVDAGGPAAQAVVNGFGDSKAYAAYPYPGEIVLTAHGLSQGAAPPYPLIAQSSNPTSPQGSVSQGPYDLKAASTDDASSAVATATADGGAVVAGRTRSSASVRRDPATGVVTSEAETTLEGLSFGGVLSISRVHSHVRVVGAPGATPVRKSDTEFGDVTISGQQVGLTDKGLVLAGTTTPLPPDSTANAALAAAGITVHYLAPYAGGSTATAPGLSVSVLQDVPGAGRTTVTYTVGQVSATARPGVVAAVGDAVPAVGSVDRPDLPLPAGAAGPTAGIPSGGSLGSASAPAEQTPAAAVAAPQAAAQQAAPSYRGVGLSTGPSSVSLYAVVAVGAVVMAAAAQLFRVLAVRLAWT